MAAPIPLPPPVMKTRIPRRLGNCANADDDGVAREVFAMVMHWFESAQFNV